MDERRQIRILALCLAAAAVCAIVLALMRGGGEEEAEEPPRVTDIPAGEVQGLVLKNGSGTIGLLNLPSGVEVDGQDTSLYDQGKLIRLFYAASHLTASGTVEGETAEYGLDSPAAQVSLLTDGGTVRLSLGRRCPVSSEYYLRREGEDAVYRVPEETAGLLLQGVSDLRDLALYPPLTEETIGGLTRIALTNGGGTMELRQLQTDTISSFYGLTAPVTAPLNWMDVNELLLTPLRELTPDRFVSEGVPLSQYGLDSPDAVLELEISGRTYRCGFAPKDQDTWYCADLDGTLVREVNGEQAAFLETTFMDLIGNSIYTRSAADIARLTARYGREQVTLEISGEAEFLTASLPGRQLDSRETVAFYSQVDAIPAAGLLTGEESIQGSPMLTLAYTLRDGGEDLLEFYPVTDRRCAVVLNGEAEFTTYTTVVNDLIDAYRRLADGEEKEA